MCHLLPFEQECSVLGPHCTGCQTRTLMGAEASEPDILCNASASRMHCQDIVFPWCRQIHTHREAEAKERQAEMELLSADPFDPEVQARIAERIRQAQVEENYQNAYEYMPESFSQVTMLYVDMEVRPTTRLHASAILRRAGEPHLTSPMH